MAHFLGKYSSTIEIGDFPMKPSMYRGFSTAMLDSTRGYTLQKDHFRTSWWYTYPSEQDEFVSGDDEIPNVWKHKIHVPVTTNQISISISKYIYIYI